MGGLCPSSARTSVLSTDRALVRTILVPLSEINLQWTNYKTCRFDEGLDRGQFGLVQGTIDSDMAFVVSNSLTVILAGTETCPVASVRLLFS